MRKSIHVLNMSEYLQIDIDFGLEELEELSHKLIKDFLKEYEYLGYGGTRAVFDMGDGNVLKVAYNHDGIEANRREATWERTDIPVAECSSYKDEYDSGLCVIMEKVSIPHTWDIDVPDWVGYVDCGQVGFNKNGELVAYDL